MSRDPGSEQCLVILAEPAGSRPVLIAIHLMPTFTGSSPLLWLAILLPGVAAAQRVRMVTTIAARLAQGRAHGNLSGRTDPRRPDHPSSSVLSCQRRVFPGPGTAVPCPVVVLV